MIFGTLSFELRGEEMVPSGESRADIIANIVKEYSVGFLLCAGWSLDDDANLAYLVKKLAEIKSTASVIVEVKNSAAINCKTHPVNRIFPERETSRHVMYLLNNTNDPVALGPQYFSTSGELATRKKREPILQSFEEGFHSRIVNITNKLAAVALCCGEINLYKGRYKVLCQSASLHQKILAADIVVNPTHDGMANYGTLNSKRKHLSQKVDGRSRLFISSSNWNTKKPQGSKGKVISQSPLRESLQTIYLDGEQQVMIRKKDAEKFEFRMADISL